MQPESAPSTPPSEVSGRRHVSRYWSSSRYYLNDSFFEDDESLQDVVLAFERGVKHVTTGPSVDNYEEAADEPSRGVGWCAPSP